VPGHINFKWNHSNLDNGRVLGRAAAKQAIAAYEKENLTAHTGPRFINENPEIEHPEGWKRVREKYHQCLKRAAVQDQGKGSSMTDLLSQTSGIFSPDHRS
jgi:hypothetical protein